jgi:hypothetical protein
MLRQITYRLVKDGYIHGISRVKAPIVVYGVNIDHYPITSTTIISRSLSSTPILFETTTLQSIPIQPKLPSIEPDKASSSRPRRSKQYPRSKDKAVVSKSDNNDTEIRSPILPAAVAESSNLRPFEITVEKGRSKALTKIAFLNRMLTIDRIEESLAQLNRIQVSDMSLQVAIDLILQSAVREVSLSPYTNILQSIVQIFQSPDIVLTPRQLGDLGMGLLSIRGRAKVERQLIDAVRAIILKQRYHAMNSETISRLIAGLKHLELATAASEADRLIHEICNLIDSQRYEYSAYHIFLILSSLRDLSCASNAQSRLADRILGILETWKAPEKLASHHINAIFFAIRYLTKNGQDSTNVPRMEKILTLWLAHARVKLNESAIGCIALGVQKLMVVSKEHEALYQQLTNLIINHRQHIALTETSLGRVCKLLFYLDRNRSSAEKELAEAMLSLVLEHRQEKLIITRDRAFGDLFFALRVLGRDSATIPNDAYTSPLLSLTIGMVKSSPIVSLQAAAMSAIFGGLRFLAPNSSFALVEELFEAIIPKLVLAEGQVLSAKQACLVMLGLQSMSGETSAERKLMDAVTPMLEAAAKQLRHSHEVAGHGYLMIAVGLRKLNPEHEECRRILRIAASFVADPKQLSSQLQYYDLAADAVPIIKDNEYAVMKEFCNHLETRSKTRSLCEEEELLLRELQRRLQAHTSTGTL